MQTQVLPPPRPAAPVLARMPSQDPSDAHPPRPAHQDPRDAHPLWPAHQDPRPAHPSRDAPPVRGAHPVLLRRARLVALVIGGFLLPWSVLLAVMLPAAAQAQHWSLAWAGLDAAEAIAALVTAVLLARADARASLPAAAAGTLLLIDAWFDVCTSTAGAGQALALAEAALVEVPLAVAAWWLAITLTRRAR